jgi:hypothetical protein
MIAAITIPPIRTKTSARIPTTQGQVRRGLGAGALPGCAGALNCDALTVAFPGSWP